MTLVCPVLSNFSCHACKSIKYAYNKSSRTSRCSALPARSFQQAAGALLRSRAKHSALDGATFRDEYAEILAEAASTEDESRCTSEAEDVKSTAYIDQQVLTALDLVDLDLKREYRQVVLLGCGFDTRPYRLLWPEGTVIYEVAPAEAHTIAYKVLKEQKASVSRGSLFRRVPWNFEVGTSFEAALQQAGHQGSRLSVWGIQVSMASAFGSIVVGELPPMQKQTADQLLAEHSFLGVINPVLETTQDVDGPQRWLFTTQHKSLSSEEMETYEQHVSAAEETDEDFFDNFS